MNNNRKFHRIIVLLGMAFVLMIGLSLPAPTLQTASAADDEGNEEDDGSNGDSGGFTIHADKVDGEMNVPDALLGKIDIKEGNIYGLTITKELDKTGSDNGPLVIKIKTPSDKPIPLENLKAETKGHLPPNFAGLCTPEQVGWACLSDVSMTVTEQTAGSISLPDATIETCFKGHCQEDEETDSTNTAKTTSLSQNKSLKDIQEDITGFKEQIKKVQELIKKSQDQQNTIEDKGQVATLQDVIEEAQQMVDHPDQYQDLEKSAKEISQQYRKLNDQVSDLAMNAANADDILKQISNQIDQDKKRLKELAKEKEKKEKKANDKEKSKESKIGVSIEDLQKQLDKQQDKKKKQNDDKKQNDKKKSADGQNKDKDSKDKDKKPEINSKDLQKQLAKVKEKMEDPRDQADKLIEAVLKGEKQDALTEQLKDFYKDIDQISGKIKESQDNDAQDNDSKDNDSNDQAEKASEDTDSGDQNGKDPSENIRESLNVAKQGQMIGKQISDIQEQIDKKTKKKDDLLDDANKDAKHLQKQVDQANGTVEKSKLPVETAKNISEQKKQLKQDLEDVNKKTDDIRDQLKGPIDKLKTQVDKKLDHLQDRVQMPEDMAKEYKNQPLPQKDINDYRADMKDHLKEWKKQRKQIKDDMDNQKQLDQAKDQQEKIIESIDDLRVTIKEDREQYSNEPFKEIIKNLQTANASEDHVKDGEEPSSNSDGNDQDKSSSDDGNKDQTDTKGQTNSKTNHSEDISAINQAVNQANSEIDKLEQTSNHLTDKILMINSLNKKRSDQFKSHLNKLDGYVDDLKHPVQHLNKDKGQRGNNEKKALRKIRSMRSNLKDLKHILDDLPTFQKVDKFIGKTNDMVTEVDTMLK